MNPDSLDLGHLLGPARDQGQRPTCLSFALSDAHRGARNHNADFSAECLHQRSAESLGRKATQAVTPSAALTTLLAYGQVEERVWPYNKPKPDLKGSTSFKASQTTFYFKKKLVEQCLVAKQPVVIVLAIGTEFFATDGISSLKTKTSPTQAMHAVLIVSVRKEQDGTLFLLRNSWGPKWGRNGHLWAHEEYLDTTSSVCIALQGIR